MAIKEAGIWPCTITSAAFGENDRGIPYVQINGRIDDGPSKGIMFTYEDEVSAKSAPYVRRSCVAVGWKGQSLQTLKADCSAWIGATKGTTTVEVKHLPLKRGKKYDEWIAAGAHGDPPIWDKVNGIGRGAKPLAEPSKQSLADADEAMRLAMGEMPPDDNNHVPPPDDTDVPF